MCAMINNYNLKFSSLRLFSASSRFRSRSFRRQRPADIVLKEKSSPISAPDFEKTPEVVEKFYSDFINQPRSKLKLPVDELIKDHRLLQKLKASSNFASSTMTDLASTSVTGDSQIPVPLSKADKLLQVLRSDNCSLIPRLETFQEISKEFALDGSFEKAESLILNMKKDFGVEPSPELMSLLSLSYFNGGRKGTALKVLDKLPEWEVTAQTIYKYLISDALKDGNFIKAENLYSVVLRHCNIPSPEITGLMLLNYGKTDRVELGLKLYKELISKGMEVNPVTHAAMIYLCTRRKTHFKEAVQFFDQMKLLNFPIHLRVHNYMLQGCSKVADLDRAIEIWNNLVEKSVKDPNLQPNQYSMSSVLWTLASAETSETKLSKRDFHYDMSTESLLSTADKIYTQGSMIMKPNSHISNAYLAILSNNLAIERAERLFHTEMEGMRTEHSYELMFKMYDSTRDWTKTVALKQSMHLENLVVPFEGWRAMIRTAALNKQLETSLKWLEEMVASGYKPSIEDLKVVKLRLCEERKFALLPQFETLCLSEPKIKKNKIISWRDRSHQLQDFFVSLYGSAAPKITTAKPA